MKLCGLRYTRDDDYAQLFKEKCLSGSKYLKLINKLIQDEDFNFKFCHLEDASQVEITKKELVELYDIIKDSRNFPDFPDENFFKIFSYESKVNISLQKLKLYEKNITFYESYGYIPIFVNIKEVIVGQKLFTMWMTD